MKTKIKNQLSAMPLMALIGAMIMLFNSCSNDEFEDIIVDEPTNEIIMSGISTEVLSGHIKARNYNSNVGSAWFILVDDMESTNLSEKTYVAANLIDLNEASITAGEYVFTIHGDSPSENNRVMYQFNVGITGKGLYEGQSGSLTLTEHSEHNYTLSGTMMVKQFQDVEGNYTGDLGIVEELTFSYTGDFIYSQR